MPSVNLLDLLRPLLVGMQVTLELAALVLAIGTIFGVLGGAFSVWGGRWLRTAIALLVFLTRGIPLLVQVFIVFFILPLMGLDLSAFVSSALALSIFATATITEIVRGGIRSVPYGQMDAALALGFSTRQAAQTIMLPQAMLVILPSLVTQFVFLVKATSIISLLGVPEIMLAGREVIERTLQGLPVMAAIWLFYTAICYPLTVLGRALESMTARRGFKQVLA